MKKLLSFLLAFMLIISAVPFDAFDFTVSAATSGTVGNLTWEIDNGTLTISGEGDMLDYGSFMSTPWYYAASFTTSTTAIVIADGVKNIGANAFGRLTSLKTVSIGNSVENIGELAFENCSELEKYDIDEQNKYYCSIDGVLFDKGIKTLVDYPEGKKDTTYIIPNSVENIKNNAFSNCSYIINITIPESVTTIEDSAFYKTISLESINVEENNNAYISNAGVLYNKNGTDLIAYPVSKNDASYTIPDSVENICNGAIAYNKKLTNIIIPDSVQCIGSNAFYSCKISELTIGNSVKKIGHHAFGYCDALTNLTIPDNVVNVGEYAFEGCSALTNVTISGDNSDFGFQSFAGTNNIKSVYLFADIETLCAGFVADTQLLLWLEFLFLNGELLTDLIVPSYGTTVASGAFEGYSGLKSVTLSEGVTTIEYGAFSECTNLETIVLPSTITNICVDSFYCFNPSSPKEVWYAGSKSDMEKIGIEDTTILSEATWHYNICKTTEHKYTNGCLKGCDNCDWQPQKHIYDNACDAVCNICDERRNTRHDYKIVVTKPTCTEQGYTTHTCDMCGDNYVDDYVDANGHTYDDDYDAICNVCYAERDAKKHGDASGDGVINAKDCVQLIQFINGWNVDIDTTAADVNADGKVNSKDYVLLMRYINGWDVELQ